MNKDHKLNLAEFGLGYTGILSLMDLGLIHHSEIESGELPIGTSAEWRCAGHNIEFTCKECRHNIGLLQVHHCGC